MKINLTKLEADALFFTSGQMSDDFLNYYSFMPPNKRKKYHEAFESARGKLLQIIHNRKQNPERSVATGDDSSNADDNQKV